MLLILLTALIIFYTGYLIGYEVACDRRRIQGDN